MKMKKSPEFDRDVLAAIEPHKREDFKKVLRKQRYLHSGLFLFIWHTSLIGISFPVVKLLFKVLPSLKQGLEELLSFYAAGIISFFLAIVVAFGSRKVRHGLNQRGITSVHVIFIGLLLFYVSWWVIDQSPTRGY